MSGREFRAHCGICDTWTDSIVAHWSEQHADLFPDGPEFDCWPDGKAVITVADLEPSDFGGDPS